MIDSKKNAERRNANVHKQKRTILTRQELLRSARAIFARDGFEHTRLEDIASRAGKTRGAFYANFKDKEDVFFAIFEENIDRDMEKLGLLLASFETIEQRIESLGEYLSKLTKDRERILLDLEFKLYAIRHPRKRKRLADLYSAMRFRSSMPELSRFFSFLKEQGTNQKLTNSFVICAIMNGLALNLLFDPNVLDDQTLSSYLNLFLRDILLGIPAQTQKRK